MQNITDNDILEGVLDEFKKIAKIPRPSGHEEKISAFLKDYFAEMGFESVQDEVNNVIINIPATKNFENAPLTVLQAHMDMVAVASVGVPFNPTEDPIRLIRDDEYLRAAGTSLGADDGMGVAIMMYIAKNLKEHGALRFIFTVDEEVGMIGAEKLDAKYLTDAKYLINCDSEEFDQIIVGCAGNITMEFKKRLERARITKNNILTIELTGLKGGHSGERIGDNGGNAIIALLSAIRNLESFGEVEIISIDGGSARNVIPSVAKAVIATDIDTDTLNIALMEEGRNLYKVYNEEDAEFIVEEGRADFGAIKKEIVKQIYQFTNLIHCGVYAMAGNIPETSANLGVASTDENTLIFSFLPRSSKDKKLDMFISKAKDLAELTEFEAIIGKRALDWSQKNGKLAGVMASIFKDITGLTMKIEEMHAGIECGFHHKSNPNLDMVSIGTTNEEIHSPRERLKLSTVAPITRLIARTLAKIRDI